MSVVSKNSRKVPSQQMRAVLHVLSGDPSLEALVKPHIDFENESILWEHIFAIPFGSGHRAAVMLAFGLWTDQLKLRSNPFSAALAMDANLQRAYLEAQAIRWGLVS